MTQRSEKSDTTDQGQPKIPLTVALIFVHCPVEKRGSSILIVLWAHNGS